MEIKYNRQNLIPDWDQDKLTNASVAVVGAGALGNHVCLGLIGLGIGTIKIFDYDTISPDNLNRQSLFCEDDIGQNKAEVLATRLEERNSSIMIIGIDEKIEENTIDNVIRQVDLVIDCVDLIYVRWILNKYCLLKNMPLIHGGISWCGGQTGILTRETPCIKCIYPKSMQIEELNVETSCTRSPEASVVYISQIIAGLMVENVRRVLMPLPSDPPRSHCLIKMDLRLNTQFYFQYINRKDKCECIPILKQFDPDILKQEKKAKNKQRKMELDELKQVLEKGDIL